MLRVWDFWDEGCPALGMLGCGMLGLWDADDVGCWGCGMFRMRNVWDVGCSGCEIFRMWDIWDVECVPECGMLIYKMPIKTLVFLLNKL